MPYSVGELAHLAGVTVRTLHHYDEVGLLRPAGRSRGGHRVYSDEDVARLQQILAYRELGFGLDEVAELLRDGDPITHLRRQRELLTARAQRLTEMAEAVEAELQARAAGITLTAQARLAVFGTWRPPPGYAEEVARRWMGTAQWAQSQERAARYTVEQLSAMQAETSAWIERVRAAMLAGKAPTSEVGVRLAEEQRQAIDRWWFDCPPAVHRQVVAAQAADPVQMQMLVPAERQLDGMGEWLLAAAEANPG